MLIYFASSWGEGGSGNWKYDCYPWEDSQVLCCPRMLPWPDIISEQHHSCPSGTLRLFSEVQLSAQVSAPPTQVILGDDRELKQSMGLCMGLVHAHSICFHAWIVSLTHQLFQSISANRKGKQLREQENHKIWMRP